MFSLKCTSWCSSVWQVSHLHHIAKSGEWPGWTSSELFRGEIITEGRCCENGCIMKLQISFKTAWGVPLKFHKKKKKKFHVRCHSCSVTSVCSLIHASVSYICFLFSKTQLTHKLKVWTLNKIIYKWSVCCIMQLIMHYTTCTAVFFASSSTKIKSCQS